MKNPLAAAAACVLALASPPPTRCGVGDIVLDPTNLVQNTLTAIRTLEQINNQIRSSRTKRRC
jgi:P-type conjugative transfer protein TrbJ